MTDLNALADWLEKSPTATLGFVKDGLTKVVTPKYLLKSDVDWIIAQARAAASSQAGVIAMREKWTDNKINEWSSNWHWQDCAENKPVDPSIYPRDRRMIKAFIAAAIDNFEVQAGPSDTCHDCGYRNPCDEKCPNCNDANEYGDYEGPTCEVCGGTGRVAPGPSEAPPSQEVGHNWQLSDDGKKRIAEIDGNIRHAMLNADNIIAGNGKFAATHEEIAASKTLIGPSEATPSQEPVAVKPLEWDEHGRADVYSIVEDILRSPPDFFVARGSKIIGHYDDIDAAKAAAQADYEQRIRSALVSPTPAPSGNTEALRTALDQIIISAMEWHPSENGPSYIEHRADLQSMLNAALRSHPTPARDGNEALL